MKIHDNKFLCDQNVVNDTVKFFTSKYKSCQNYCLDAGLIYLKEASALHTTCTPSEDYSDIGCLRNTSNRLCTCDPFMEFDDSKVVKASARVKEASQYDLAYKLEIPDKPNLPVSKGCQHCTLPVHQKKNIQVMVVQGVLVIGFVLVAWPSRWIEYYTYYILHAIDSLSKLSSTGMGFNSCVY